MRCGAAPRRKGCPARCAAPGLGGRGPGSAANRQIHPKNAITASSRRSGLRLATAPGAGTAGEGTGLNSDGEARSRSPATDMAAKFTVR